MRSRVSASVARSPGFCRRNANTIGINSTAQSTCGLLPRAVGADANEILGLGMHGQDFPQLASGLLMAGVRHLAVNTADAPRDADGRIMAALRQAALQHDMPIEQAARRVGDRLVEIVAVHQHGEDASDAAGRGVAELLHRARQQLKYRRRVAARAGRFAQRQTQLALRHRQARQTVEHEEDIGSARAEIVGHGDGHLSGAARISGA